MLITLLLMCLGGGGGYYYWKVYRKRARPNPYVAHIGEMSGVAAPMPNLGACSRQLASPSGLGVQVGAMTPGVGGSPARAARTSRPLPRSVPSLNPSAARSPPLRSAARAPSSEREPPTASPRTAGSRQSDPTRPKSISDHLRGRALLVSVVRARRSECIRARGGARRRGASRAAEDTARALLSRKALPGGRWAGVKKQGKLTVTGDGDDQWMK